MRALPLALRLRHRAGLDQSANEMTSALMKPRSKSVWMTPAACGAFQPFVDRPGARLLGPGGEVGLQAERVEADAGELVEARLVLAGRREQLRGVLGVEVDELRLDLGVRGSASAGATSARELGDPLRVPSASSSTLKT